MKSTVLNINFAYVKFLYLTIAKKNKIQVQGTDLQIDKIKTRPTDISNPNALNGFPTGVTSFIKVYTACGWMEYTFKAAQYLDEDHFTSKVYQWVIFLLKNIQHILN